MKRRAPISFGLPGRESIEPPRIDLQAATGALRPRPRSVDRVLAATGWLGSPPQGRLIPPGLAATAAVSIGPRAAAWQLAAWGVAPFGSLLKRAARRPRPPTALLPLPGSRGGGSGFPSTHVATYAGVYGFAAWLALRRSPLLLPFAVAAAAPVVLIGPSRIRAGDHWLSDVVAGYALGLGWLVAVVVLSSRDDGLRRELESRRATLPRAESGAAAAPAQACPHASAGATQARGATVSPRADHER